MSSLNTISQSFRQIQNSNSYPIPPKKKVKEAQGRIGQIREEA
jgi:hypothetical protein